MHWVTDAQYMVVPKGVPPTKLAVVLDLMECMLTPEQQAKTYDKGYFYPGPAVNGVPLSMAPKGASRSSSSSAGPSTTSWIAEVPEETPLPAEQQVAAFDQWDQHGRAARKVTQVTLRAAKIFGELRLDGVSRALRRPRSRSTGST